MESTLVARADVEAHTAALLAAGEAIVLPKATNELAPQAWQQTIVPAQSETYEQRFVKPYTMDDFDTIIEQSHLGTGKTAQIIGNATLRILGLLKARLGQQSLDGTPDPSLPFKYPRVLFVSARKTFSEFVLGDMSAEGLAACADYRASQRQLARDDRLVIQIESLHRLADGFTPYDLVILDEVESLLAQLHSLPTNGANLRARPMTMRDGRPIGFGFVGSRTRLGIGIIIVFRILANSR